MKVIRAVTIVILAAIVAVLMEAGASAQQPTPAAPSNPSWCPGVPESPPPPYFENNPGDWAKYYKACSVDRSTISSGDLHDYDKMCGRLCMRARSLWGSSRNPPTENPYPLSTDKLQGPFPLPGGGSGYVLPGSSFAPSPAASATPSANRHSSRVGFGHGKSIDPNSRRAAMG